MALLGENGTFPQNTPENGHSVNSVTCATVFFSAGDVVTTPRGEGMVIEEANEVTGRIPIRLTSGDVYHFKAHELTAPF